jgi:hypothetical protein
MRIDSQGHLPFTLFMTPKVWNLVDSVDDEIEDADSSTDCFELVGPFPIGWKSASTPRWCCVTRHQFRILLTLVID